MMDKFFYVSRRYLQLITKLIGMKRSNSTYEHVEIITCTDTHLMPNEPVYIIEFILTPWLISHFCLQISTIWNVLPRRELKQAGILSFYDVNSARLNKLTHNYDSFKKIIQLQFIWWVTTCQRIVIACYFFINNGKGNINLAKWLNVIGNIYIYVIYTYIYMYTIPFWYVKYNLHIKMLRCAFGFRNWSFLCGKVICIVNHITWCIILYDNE